MTKCPPAQLRFGVLRWCSLLHWWDLPWSTATAFLLEVQAGGFKASSFMFVCGVYFWSDFFMFHPFAIFCYLNRSIIYFESISIFSVIFISGLPGAVPLAPMRTATVTVKWFNNPLAPAKFGAIQLKRSTVQSLPYLYKGAIILTQRRLSSRPYAKSVSGRWSCRKWCVSRWTKWRVVLSATKGVGMKKVGSSARTWRRMCWTDCPFENQKLPWLKLPLQMHWLCSQFAEHCGSLLKHLWRNCCTKSPSR